jgi:cyclic lactone autoinducer peptide
MKATEKLTKLLVSVSKKAAKNNINSTSSPWTYQPKMPKNAEELKKK